MGFIELYGKKIEYDGKRMARYNIAPWGFPAVADVDVTGFERLAGRMSIPEFLAFVCHENLEARGQLREKDSMSNVIEPASGMRLIVTRSQVEFLREPLENLVAFTDKIMRELAGEKNSQYGQIYEFYKQLIPRI